jgi:hypothetical protein
MYFRWWGNRAASGWAWANLGLTSYGTNENNAGEKKENGEWVPAPGDIHFGFDYSRLRREDFTLM